MYARGLRILLLLLDTPRKATFNLGAQGFSAFTLKPLVVSAASAKGSEVSLEPFGVMIAEVNR